MSKEAKNEIDLMLRQMGRREDAAVFESDAQHLDADELNSYVANALPAAARVRYMEHLADCASCRKLVAQLSAAEGPIVVQQAGTIPAPSALKQFLTSLLSPMVLRYAIPALGVLVIMVVGFVVMRRDAAKNSIAEVMTPDRNGTVAIPKAPSPGPSGESLFDNQRTEETAKRDVQSETQKPSRGQAEASDDARTGQAGGVAAPVTANEPPPTNSPAEQPSANKVASEAPPPPKPATESEDATRRADREKKAPVDTPSREKLAEVQVSERGANSAPAQQTRVAASPGSAVNRSLEVGRLSAGGVAGRTEKAKRPAKDEERDAVDKTSAKDEAANEKNEKEAETRSVAGRQFRKSGNVWIDTAYDRSQQTTTMARGSEQYRTLVGDEPEIRRIAEQLDGEFIVVWKGRAYRIR